MTSDNSSTCCHVQAAYEKLRLEAESNFCNSAVLTKVGIKLFLLNEFPEEARFYLKRAIEIDSKNIDARFWLATCMYRDICDYDSAKKLLDETIELAPNRADCLILMAYVLLDLEEFSNEAVYYLKEALKIEPSWTAPRRQLIQVYIMMGKFKLAEQELNELAEVIESMGQEDIKINNLLEDYYETAVTGRLNIQRNYDRLIRLTKELENAKLEQGLTG